ncbi:response regulator [Desulforhopalus sp. 52FAK]
MKKKSFESAREKFLGFSLESSRKSYYPQLLEQLENAKNNEKRLQLLIDNLPARISYVDTKEIFVLANSGYEYIFKKKKDAVIGSSLKDVLGEVNYKKVKPYVEKVLEGTEVQFETPVITPDGKTFWNEISYIPTFKTSGQVDGFYVLARDLTSKKRSEEEKKKLESKLYETEKFKTIGTLAGGIAHDFNNMLGVITGYSELILAQTDSSHPFYAELEEIRKAARRSADLTRQLLTFARKQTVTPKVLNLNLTVEGMLNMLRQLIGENINFVWAPGTNLWPIKMDPSQIDQILANLCINARDAILPDVGKITIETKNTTVCDNTDFISKEFVKIVVSDTGGGMDKETLSHIFEPFFTTKGVGEGTGLGLATVYGAVKQNNGFIKAFSKPGQDTAFIIHIPRYIGEPTSTIEYKESIPHGDETIMLVEDEPTFLKMTKRMLEKLGYTVLAAGHPKEAILLANSFDDHIHLLVTDVIMPGMNGSELAKQLLEIRPEMKRLFMSGYADNIIANQGVLKGGMFFIQKPFTIDDIASEVRRALRG